MNQKSNKWEEIFRTYAPALEGDALAKALDKIIKDNYEASNTIPVKKMLHGTIDLTTLAGADTETKVAKLVSSVNDFEGTDDSIPSVAAICVYPNFVSTVLETLTAEGVRVACVSGAFPASQSFTEVKVAEVALASLAGAHEIDIVLNLGRFLEEDYEEAGDEIGELKTAARDAHLKVILETGALETQERIRRASILALECGADFIKTSTGKEYPGASLEAAYTMCQVIKEFHAKTGERRGIKFSGGIKSAEDAVRYYCIVKAVLGDEWLTPELMRIGASSLVANLQAEIL